MTLTPLFLTGFEHGVAATGGNFFSQVVAATITSTSPRSGSYCLHSVGTGAVQSSIRFGITATAKIVERFAIKVSTRPPSVVAHMKIIRVDNGSFIQLWVTTAGVLQLNGGGTTINGPTID